MNKSLIVILILAIAISIAESKRRKRRRSMRSRKGDPKCEEGFVQAKDKDGKAIKATEDTCKDGNVLQDEGKICCKASGRKKLSLSKTKEGEELALARVKSRDCSQNEETYYRITYKHSNCSEDRVLVEVGENNYCCATYDMNRGTEIRERRRRRAYRLK